VADALPAIDAPVLRTARGTPYLREPGVALLSLPATDLRGMAGFLGGFDAALGFPGYLQDPDPLPPAEALCKAAGQTCYASFGPRRTPNARAAEYLENIRASGHGSVLEHAAFTVLLYGVSRSLTHELVRHRAGTAFCLAGDTRVSAGRGRGPTIRELFAGQGQGPPPRLRCLDEAAGRFTRGAVRRVVYAGERPVFRVTLEDGRTICCTREHRVLTPAGWMALADAVGGLAVSPGGAALHGRLDTPLVTSGRRIPRLRAAAGRGRILAARTARAGGGGVAVLVRARAARGPGPRPRRIVAVDYAGVRPTYDVEMEGPHHNFVAGGVVVHNSQVSQRYVAGSVLRFVERPEYQADAELHALFEGRIDAAAAAYAALTERLLSRQRRPAPTCARRCSSAPVPCCPTRPRRRSS
jgi:hypothetical protein